MRAQGKILLKALLSHSTHGQSLMNFFPPTLTEELQNLSQPQKVDFTTLLSLSEWIKPIHYSWFVSFLETLSEKNKAVFLSVFTPVQLKGIFGIFKKKITPTPPSPFLIPFLINFLKKEIEEKKTITPLQLLFSDMSLLLHLKREEILHLIDLLGIYDLAADLRQIVDKDLLGKIYDALNQDQLQFLHYCSKQPMKWISPKLGLSGWDGTKKTLNTLLHQRGLLWLARAIMEEPVSFHWHLLHHLDTGRAKIIRRVFEQKQDLALIKYFKNQTLYIAKRFQTAA